jgi:CRP/FNR family transcriptional regulator, cyclic AMP receptor protein
VNKPVDFAKLLRVNSFFEGLEESTIERLAALCRMRQLAAGETLFVKGDAGDGLYGIRRGRIRIETTTSSGDSLTLNMLGAGDLFGEIALFDGQSRTADAVAAEPSELFVLRRADFLTLLGKDPQIAIRVIEFLCQRLRWVSDRLEEATLLPLPIRLARRLMRLGQDFGSEVNISQEQLANYVGAARESVNRQLQIWRRAGLIDLRRGRILLLDMQKLSRETGGL